MNANPSGCRHLHLMYDEFAAIVYCPDCMWWWDADFETPHKFNANWGERPTDTRVLNPDNEPTSEHMQYKDNDDA